MLSKISKCRRKKITATALLLALCAFGPAKPALAQDSGGLSELLNMSSEQKDESSALPQTGVSDNNGARNPGLQLSLDQDAAQPSAGMFRAQIQQKQGDSEQNIRDQAFNAALNGLLPLKPDEIRKLLEDYDSTRQAVEVPIYPYPEPEVVVETVSLDPGSLPPTIKVGTGHVTTVSLLDVTGEPWPIQDIGWAGNFEILQPEQGSNLIRITPLSEFAHGNMSLRLLDLKTPVLFTIKTDRESIHYRYDARIPNYGPYAETPIIQGSLTMVAGSNSALSNILDGVPPGEAEKLEVSGVDGRTTAYRYKSTIYVRTPLTLLSPGWSSSTSSADGMNVYAVSNAPVLLLSDHGQVVRAVLANKEVDSYDR